MRPDTSYYKNQLLVHALLSSNGEMRLRAMNLAISMIICYFVPINGVGTDAGDPMDPARIHPRMDRRQVATNAPTEAVELARRYLKSVRSSGSSSGSTKCKCKCRRSSKNRGGRNKKAPPPPPTSTSTYVPASNPPPERPSNYPPPAPIGGGGGVVPHHTTNRLAQSLPSHTTDSIRAPDISGAITNNPAALYFILPMLSVALLLVNDWSVGDTTTKVHKPNSYNLNDHQLKCFEKVYDELVSEKGAATLKSLLKAADPNDAKVTFRHFLMAMSELEENNDLGQLLKDITEDYYGPGECEGCCGIPFVEAIGDFITGIGKRIYKGKTDILMDMVKNLVNQYNEEKKNE